MNCTNVNCGDVVQLLPGGPKMTVEGSNETGVYCVWFDTEDNLHRDVFSESVLKFA